MKKGFVVVLQGDSITDASRNRDVEGPNCSMGYGYASLVCAKMTSEYPEAGPYIYNRGISGNRIIDLYARWKSDTLNLKPDLLSILIGVNDIWHEVAHKNGVDAERYERIYRELLDWTMSELPEVKIMLIEPFVVRSEVVCEEIFRQVPERCAIVRKLAKEYDLPLMTNDWLVEAEKEAPGLYWMHDGVHPSYAGHQRFMEAWWKVAEPLFN